MYRYILALSVILIAIPGFSQNKIKGAYNASFKIFETNDTTYHIDFFEKGVSRIYQSGYTGLMDSTGLILTEPKYDQIFDFEGDVAKVSIHRKFGLIDRLGNELIAPFASEIEPFIDVYAKCKIDYLDSRIINTKGEFINEFTYDYLSSLDHGRFTYIRGTNFGLLTPEGKEIVVIENYDHTAFEGLVQYAHYGAALVLDRADYGNLFEFHNDRAVTFAKVNGSTKFGCIDINGKIVVPIIFDRIEPFENGFATVKIHDSWGVIDHFGNIVLPCSYESVQLISEKQFIVSKDKLYGVVNRSGETLIAMKYQSILMTPDNNYILSKNDRYGVINEIGESILEFNYPTLIHLFDGLFLTHNNKKWGVINSSGKTILPFNYDGITQLTDSSGIASIYKSSYSLNTGIPRYAYQGEYFRFNKNGRIDSKNESFSKTIEMVGDFHDPKRVTSHGPSLYLPNLKDGKLSVNESTEKDEYDFVQNIMNGFKIVGVINDSPIGINSAPFQSQQLSFKKGIINSKGEFVVPMLYDEISFDRYETLVSYFHMIQCAPQNLFIVKHGDNQGVINLKNEVVIPIEYDHVQFCSGIISLTKRTTTMITDDGYGDYEEDLYQFGIADMKGRVMVPVIQREFGDSPLDKWFADETRGAKK